MNKNKVIRKYWIISILIFSVSFGIQAQSNLIPKIGFNLPTTSPIIGDIEVDNRRGFTLGLDLLAGGDKVFFNPGVHFTSNRVHLSRVDTNDLSQPAELLAKTTHYSVKIFLGAQAELWEFGRDNNIHLRGAFVPVFKAGSPDYEGTGLEDIRKTLNLEFLLGVGFDISKIIIDFDYNLSLLKEYRDADIVKNAFTIGIGFKL
jgi:hypothetical protein